MMINKNKNKNKKKKLNKELSKNLLKKIIPNAYLMILLLLIQYKKKYPNQQLKKLNQVNFQY